MKEKTSMKNCILICLVLIVATIACNFPFISYSGEQEKPGDELSVSISPQPNTISTELSSAETILSEPPSDDVLTPDDFIYLGAFRLPDASGGSNWEYSGRGLTYYPEGDPSGETDGFPGSLFGVGHDHQQFVSEINIPVPVVSRSLEDLPFAITLQPFADITEGMFGETDLPRLGLQYLPPQGAQTTGKLHFVHGQHFQDFEPSHGWSELDLSHPNAAGPWIMNGYTNYVTSDYVFEIPVKWAATLPGSPRLATGRFREGVWAGGGPALFAIGPWAEGNPPPAGSILQNLTPLLLYGIQEPGIPDIVSDKSMHMSGYLEPDHWLDGAWLTAGNKSSVVFVGTKAVGNAWYGFANGVVWDYDCADQTPQTCPDVPEWPHDNRGYWADDYQPQIIFFNPADLVAVANGETETWHPQPYAVLDLSSIFYDPETNIEEYKQDIAGAITYDREHGVLYVIERLADEYKSVIHVWQIAED
jgi:hypothetical protein